jgi:hypothetical protein
MKVKILKGISGTWKGNSFHFAPGDEPDIDEGLARSEINANHAVALTGVKRIVERIKEPDFVVPQIEEKDVRQAVIKRRKRV